MIFMLLTLKSFLQYFSDIVLEFLKTLAILVLVSYKPVSYKKRVLLEVKAFANATNYMSKINLVNLAFHNKSDHKL